jgi:hypothetical protein
MKKLGIQILIILGIICQSISAPLQEDALLREQIFTMLKDAKPAKHSQSRSDHSKSRYVQDWSELSDLIESIMDCPQWQIPGSAISIIQVKII